ncbi:hypothetical protein [Candidatus Aquiluna sp. UB-MaderosW2red]|uniref:hypothetical protein n=1 Tax=Candidatus Aquiluna sp. UB-MaderosW2red TaxID=1855377 RepID=UPI000875D11B|nr:hypothetical protein [Candidatus Aquiluna sp. UB-MaderosW2red]SCX07982.1 hypothetical protein SAMN05216534_0698 [Candidatus Aquiluna sp. UB-MaderosW2red]
MNRWDSPGGKIRQTLYFGRLARGSRFAPNADCSDGASSYLGKGHGGVAKATYPRHQEPTQIVAAMLIAADSSISMSPLRN